RLVDDAWSHDSISKEYEVTGMAGPSRFSLTVYRNGEVLDRTSIDLNGRRAEHRLRYAVGVLDSDEPMLTYELSASYDGDVRSTEMAKSYDHRSGMDVSTGETMPRPIPRGRPVVLLVTTRESPSSGANEFRPEASVAVAEVWEIDDLVADHDWVEILMVEWLVPNP
ncbi:MAG: hypothetical protein ACOCZB_07345, partial [Spirochaetota bacterium]